MLLHNIYRQFCSLCLSKPDGNSDEEEDEEQKTSYGKSQTLTSHPKLKMTPYLNKVKKSIIAFSNSCMHSIIDLQTCVLK